MTGVPPPPPWPSSERSESTGIVENNEDWAATCAIYGTGGGVGVDDENDQKEESGLLLRTTTTTTTSSSATVVEFFDAGFFGVVSLPMSVANTTAFARRVSNNGHYRYFSVSQNPVLELKFKYLVYGKDEDEGESPPFYPTSVTVHWKHYPSEWPIEQKQPFLIWLYEHANERLRDTELSFAVCEFCEHEAVVSYHWNIGIIIIGDDDNNNNNETTAAAADIFQRDCGDSEFRLVLLPPKLDEMYHENFGTRIHPRELALGEGGHRRPDRVDNDDDSARRRRRKGRVVLDAAKSTMTTTTTTPEEYARRTLIDQWRKLYSTTCPICFDNKLYSDGILLPSCQDFFCRDCFTAYVKIKAGELWQHKTNPFVCPLEECRQPLPVMGFVKNLVSTEEEKKRVERWYKDMEFPPCHALDRCLSKKCGAMDCMRRRPTTMTTTTNVFCDVCDKTWCELCLKRVHENGEQDCGGEYVEHRQVCDASAALKFCRRYLKASADKRELCLAKYPWMDVYARSRQNDGEAKLWILQHGQSCPNCQTGVERIEGCFHIQCPNCPTHFCYECGDELFPPFYGTHHCWERSQLDL